METIETRTSGQIRIDAIDSSFIQGAIRELEAINDRLLQEQITPVGKTIRTLEIIEIIVERHADEDYGDIDTTVVLVTNSNVSLHYWSQDEKIHACCQIDWKDAGLVTFDQIVWND